MIDLSSLFSLPEGLAVERVELQENLLAVAIVSVLPFSCCPLCSQASSQVHSRYQRTLRDVPCAGRQVVFHLSVRKFFCHNPEGRKSHLWLHQSGGRPVLLCDLHSCRMSVEREPFDLKAGEAVYQPTPLSPTDLRNGLRR